MQCTASQHVNDSTTRFCEGYESRGLLALLYAWPTEGSDTRDLIAAEPLLAQLERSEL